MNSGVIVNLDMETLKRTTIIICVLSISLITIIWFGNLLTSRNLPDNFITSTIGFGASDLFYILLLWVPYHFRDSKGIKVINLASFILSILPIAAIIIILKIMSSVQC